MHLLTNKKIRFAALILLGLLLCLGLTTRRQSVALSPLLDPLPQDPLIQAYFNQSEAAVYTEPYRQQTRLGDNLEQVIVDAIARAQSSVDIAVHEINLPQVALALRDRHQAGVRVRVIMENHYNRDWSQISPADLGQLEERDRNKYQEYLQLVDLNQDGQLAPAELAQRDARVILNAAQVPLIDDTADGSKGSDLMHHKFVVIDNAVVLVGSANFTLSDVHGDFSAPDSRGNANHLLKIQNGAIANSFTQEFNTMWGDGVNGKPDSLFGLKKPYRAPQTVTLAPGSTITLQFSPTSTRQPWQQSVNGLIGQTLATATRTTDLALFVFSDQNLSNGLEASQQRGVQIRALIDPGFAYRYYSEGLDLLGVALPDSKCRYAPENRPWSRAIATMGIPQLPDGDILHHKFGLIDNRKIITGSQNWSAAANHGNDENLLVIDNPTVAAHFEREFARLYRNASLGVPTWLQAKVQEQRSRCQSSN